MTPPCLVGLQTFVCVCAGSAKAVRAPSPSGSVNLGPSLREILSSTIRHHLFSSGNTNNITSSNALTVITSYLVTVRLIAVQFVGSVTKHPKLVVI